MIRRKNRFSAQFSGRLVEMLESASYRVLSLSARRVIDRVEIELAHHGGQENGKLPVTFDHFVEYGIHRHSVAPGMREAVALGFLEITEKGRAGNAEHRSPNRFRLTYRPANGISGDGSHEWRKFRSLEDAELVADAARKNKAQKKTKTQCREMPPFGDKNRHRKSKIPVTKTGTKDVAKTGTTSISRDIAPTQPDREARPFGSAVASDPAVTSTLTPLASRPLAVGDRPEILQSRIAAKLGDNGWLILGAVDDRDLQNLTALESCGELTASILGAVVNHVRLRGAA